MLYKPRAFQATDGQAIALIQQHPFATLIRCDSDCQITHLPLFLSEDKSNLIGHFASANHHCAPAANQRHIAIFQGPNAYISAGWYSSSDQVPTWNYQVVHISGTLSFINERSEKRAIVDHLTQRHESRFDPPWTTDKMNSSLLDKMLDQITCFSLSIETIEAKFKLSQNKAAEIPNILTGLAQQGNHQAMIDIMTEGQAGSTVNQTNSPTKTGNNT